MHDRTTHESLAAYRRKAVAAPMLDIDTERHLIARFQTGCQASLQKLLASHLRLVLAMAKRYAGHSASMEDLISEGNLGLVEAARRFDAERGNRFGTYASWWVRARVRRFALVNRRIVATPSTRNARRILAGLRKTQREIAQREGRAAARGEVAHQLDVPESDVAMVESSLSGRDVSVGPSEDGATWEPRDEGATPEQIAAFGEWEALRHRRIGEALELLSEREREIVRRRFLDEDGATLAVLGESLGLSRERVRQIEKQAQKKLRVALLDCVA